MRAGRYDTVVETGTRWVRAAQCLVPGDPVEAAATVVGQRYHVDGWPLLLHARRPLGDGRVRLFFGQGRYSDPVVDSAPDALLVPAVPAEVTDVSAAYLVDLTDPDGYWQRVPVPIPAVIADDGLSFTLTLDVATTTDMAQYVGAHSWDWYVSTPSWDWQRMVEGTLTVVEGDSR